MGKIKDKIKNLAYQALTKKEYRNPLLQFPRNEPCYCKSGKKFKNCHMRTLPPKVSKEAAEELVVLMKKREALG